VPPSSLRGVTASTGAADSGGGSVTVLFFAAAAEAARRRREKVEGAAGRPLEELLERLLSSPAYGEALARVFPSCAIWVNGAAASADRVLKGGDEVAVLPPVSGGSGPAVSGGREPGAKAAGRVVARPSSSAWQHPGGAPFDWEAPAESLRGFPHQPLLNAVCGSLVTGG
jgi:molybdopterin converting factor small subunit